ncbi:MAG: hypothetical protein ACYS9C_07445 [Planctomycetota bacterium]|jgi:hypothetical protein
MLSDLTAKSLLKEMDERLAAIMKETGDSWEIEATTGDLKNWLPGGAKQKNQFLGVPWPGMAIAADAEGRSLSKRNAHI